MPDCIHPEAMTDPLAFRLNDKERSDRVDRMNELEARWGIDPANVIRKLVDAYLEYVDDHDGRPPTFPAVLVPKADVTGSAGKTRPKKE